MTRALDLPLGDGMRLEHDLYVLLQTTTDRAEGVQAFLERQTQRRGVFPRGAVEPSHVDGVVDVAIGIDVRRGDGDRCDVRRRQIPVLGCAGRQCDCASEAAFE